MKGREKEIGLLLFEFHMISSVLPCSPCPREHLNATGDCGIAATCCKPLRQASRQTQPKALFSVGDSKPDVIVKAPSISPLDVVVMLLSFK